MPRPSGPHRRRNRGKKKESAFWNRAFDFVSYRAFVGVVWLVAAVICLLVVDPIALWETGRHTIAVSNPEMARGLAVVLAVGVVGLSGLAVRRWKGDGTPDRVVENHLPDKGRQVWMGRLGALLLICGAFLVVGDWLLSHRAAPAGELVLPLNETRQTVEVTQGDRSVDRMLPLRTTLRGIGFGEEPIAEVQFARPDQDGVVPREFVPGQSLDIEGMRFVFSGFSDDKVQFRALISSAAENTIEAAGVVGDEIQISIDGPTYRIVDVTEDYLDIYAPAPGLDRETTQLVLLSQGYPLSVMGPGVQLEDERGRSFWVFERATARDDIPEALTLEQVQEVPSAVMTVTSVRPFWPFALGLMLFVLGWALIFGFPERVVRRRRDGKSALWSLNAIEDRGSGDGERPWKWSTLIGSATQITAVAALGLAYFFGATQAAVLALAGGVAVAALPTRLDGQAQRRAAIIAAAVPISVVAGSFVAFGTPFDAMSMQSEPVLWTAHIGAWLAMATALVGAGVLAEESLEKPTTGGAATVALAVWASMAAVVALIVGRGRVAGVEMGLPLVSDAGEAVWAIPNLGAVSELQIPVVAPGMDLAMLATVASGLTALGLVGVVIQKARVALFGWIGALVAAVTGLLQLAGVGRGAGEFALPGAAGYEEMATRWLQARDLPTWLADYGEFQVDGALRLDTAAMAPELAAFITVALLALAMIATTLGRNYPTGPLSVDTALSGRDLFVRAVIFGAMGWVLGPVLAWERLGAAGILAPMEWVGLSVVFFALAVLTIGWRRGPTVAEKFLRAFGPGLVLCYLVAAIALGVVGGVFPGASIPFF